MISFQNKKSQSFLLFTFIVAGLIIAVFFGAWIYMFDKMTTVLQAVNIDNNVVNFSSAVANTIAPVNNSMSGLNSIGMAILIGLILASFVEAYFVRKHPIMFVIHFFIVSLAITASIYISNEYESLMSNSLLGSIITGNTALSFVMLNLPAITTVVGFFGLILMFIRISRDTEDGRGI